MFRHRRSYLLYLTCLAGKVSGKIDMFFHIQFLGEKGPSGIVSSITVTVLGVSNMFSGNFSFSRVYLGCLYSSKCFNIDQWELKGTS